MANNFFQEVGNTKPYFKAAFEGMAGTGKTTTAAKVIIGLHQKIKSKKPVVMFDTETGSKFLKRMFDEAGIQLLVRPSRSLADLKETMKRCRDGFSDILFIDSISHVWENVLEAYKTKVKRTFIQFQDWGIIKPTWKTDFSDPFVNDPYHVVMCGRAGFEYGSEINETTGKREIYKSGIKMKVEGETAYEPDILVLMERFEEVVDRDKPKQVWREATILKDRSAIIDGKTFTNPGYDDFSPAIEDLLIAPVAKADVDEADTKDLFRTEEDKRDYVKQRDILLEEIQSALVMKYPSQTNADKQAKTRIIMETFDTGSWEKVKSLTVDELQSGLDSIRNKLEEIEKDK